MILSNIKPCGKSPKKLIKTQDHTDMISSSSSPVYSTLRFNASVNKIIVIDGVYCTVPEDLSGYQSHSHQQSLVTCLREH